MAKAVFLFHECKQMLVKKEINGKKFAKHGELMLNMGNLVNLFFRVLVILSGCTE